MGATGSQRRLVAFLGSLLVAGSVGALAASAAPPDPAAPALTPELADQIRALMAEKAARTPAQRKISSRLLYAERSRRGLALPGRLQRDRARIALDAAGRARVEIRGNVTSRMLQTLAALDGRSDALLDRGRRLRARLAMHRLEALAALPEVRWIGPPDRAFTRKVDTSEGDVAHRVDALRSALGVDGSGVIVGVLSDGVDSIPARQATGDLPPGIAILPGQAGSGDEGTAMLEIIHDLAPGAALVFATAFGGQASFAVNILALRGAGADVIVDDVGYFAEAVFQDDDVAAAVDTVVADGALYFSSAGNAGRLDAGSAGVWEGDFVDSGFTLNGSVVHDFGGGAISNEITDDGPFFFTLHWSDALAQSANDYDLVLVDPALTTILDASTDTQDGDDDPFEAIDTGFFNDTGNRLMVVRFAGSDRMLHVNTIRGELGIATDGQLSGHPGARGAVAVAAVDVAAAAGPGGVFDGSEPVESFSSDGPRRVHYEADGTPITPGDFSSGGGELRPKPDLTAADCVETSTPGFGVFCGTSAAAPHAAAIAAVLLERALLTGSGPAEVLSAMSSSALDLAPAGADRNAGVGLIDALAAGAALSAPACDDGIDNDADGLTDSTEDPGCDDALDDSERSPSLPCDNGLDDDGDGLTDFPADPACRDVLFGRERSRCQDGLDNDGFGGTDFDGGESILGAGNGDPAGPDPDCAGRPWRDREIMSCGAGAELALSIALLGWWRRRRSSLSP